jgi:NADH-quinone oxidoreductase subunit J
MFPEIDHLLGNTYFALFALASLLCATGMLFSKHPLHATIYLIGVMLSISGIYALLSSPFLGVIQVLVYAGAIMMLVVFVIMVLNRARDHEVPLFDQWSIPAAALPVVLLITFAMRLSSHPLLLDAQAVRGDIAPIARSMFDVRLGHGYWLLFEAIGVLLLVAVVGAVLLAKRSLETPIEPATVAEEEHGSH